MAQVTVLTTTTTLDPGTAGYLAIRNLGQVHVTVLSGGPVQVVMPGCTMVLSPGGVAVTARTPAGTAVVDVTVQPAPDGQAFAGRTGVVTTRVSGAGTLVTRAAAPTLAELAPGEMAIATDASGNLRVWSNVAGVLKSATVTVA